MPPLEYQGEEVIPGEPMVLVEQVIDRPMKDDCRNYTDVVWHGQGDVQEYPARLWPKLALHPDVWRLVDKKPPTDAELRERDRRAALSLSQATAAGSIAGAIALDADALASMDDDEVRAEGKARRYGLHHTYAGQKLREAFLEAQTRIAQAA